MRTLAALVLRRCIDAREPRRATSAPAGASFPCRWNWDLRSGLPPGKIVAGFSTGCSTSLGGTLTIGARLLKWNPKSRTWHLEKTRQQRWTSYAGRRFVELIEPCTAGSFKATFDTVVRKPDGTIAGHVAVKSGTLRVVVPCVFSIG